MSDREAPGGRVHGGARLLHRHPGREPEQRLVGRHIPARHDRRGAIEHPPHILVLELQRGSDRQLEIESRWQDADDRVLGTAEPEQPADNRRIGRERAAPEAMTHQDVPFAAVARVEQAPERWPGAKHRVARRLHLDQVDALDAVIHTKAAAAAPDGRRGVEYGYCGDIREIRITHLPLLSPSHLPENNQTLSLRIRQRPPENAVDDRERHDAGGDGDCGQQGNPAGEDRMHSQRPRGRADVVTPTGPQCRRPPTRAAPRHGDSLPAGNLTERLAIAALEIRALGTGRLPPILGVLGNFVHQVLVSLGDHPSHFASPSFEPLVDHVAPLSGFADVRDAIQRGHETVPGCPLIAENGPPRSSDPVIASPPLPCLLNPFPTDQAASLQLVECWIERRRMKRDLPSRPHFDQPGDLVAMPAAFFEHAEHQQLRAALPQFRRKHRVFICRVFTCVKDGSNEGASLVKNQVSENVQILRDHGLPGVTAGANSREQLLICASHSKYVVQDE